MAKAIRAWKGVMRILSAAPSFNASGDLRLAPSVGGQPAMWPMAEAIACQAGDSATGTRVRWSTSMIAPPIR